MKMKKSIKLILAFIGLITISSANAQSLGNDQLFTTFGKPSKVSQSKDFSVGLGVLSQNKFMFEFTFNIQKSEPELVGRSELIDIFNGRTSTNSGVTKINPSINFGYNVNNRNENHSIIPILGLNFKEGAVNEKVVLNYGILFRSKVSELISVYYGYSDMEKIRVGIGITPKR